MNGSDPWSQIVDWLHGQAPDMRESRELCRPARSPVANASSIDRIERQTTSTILVSWSDSTFGRYQDQMWRAGFARTSGVCGLTGAPVRRGDPVFRPLVRVGAKPLNALDMILAATLQREWHVPSSDGR
ncbi:DUF3331 domain-containing protein [Paraburkholderia phymatum]|uniref:DUF3331 domain-containing protein n=1 Tax=Paraburkholderia phymatum TaxID=148447 RepID=A0ACC6U2F9_9BURK